MKVPVKMIDFFLIHSVFLHSHFLVIDSRGVNLFNPIQLYWSIAHTHLVCSMVRLISNAISLFKAPNCELIRSLTVWHHPYVVQITQNKFKQLLFNSEVTKRCECLLLNLLFHWRSKTRFFYFRSLRVYTWPLSVLSKRRNSPESNKNKFDK